jgi:hypothetical protein
VTAIGVAAKGKGIPNLVRRSRMIGARYGLTPRRMERRLEAVHRTVRAYGAAPTLPITAAAARRHPSLISRYAGLGIEFAVHGFYHVDHTGLSSADQVEQLGRARRLLESIGVRAVGFRAPYLRVNDATIKAVRDNGFLYDSSQAFAWPLDEGMETDAYRRALEFYSALPAARFPVLPWSDGDLVRIPCCLPDDEAMVDRLGLTPGAMADVWVSVLAATRHRGELLTLALHPERIETCAEGLVALLEAARGGEPPVWVARLEEIANWWRERARSTVSTQEVGHGRLRISVRGPKGLTVLARNVGLRGETGFGAYVRVPETRFEVLAQDRPFIGVHPSSSESLVRFLREQGYIVETGESPAAYQFFFRRDRFSQQDERALLDDLESAPFPLIRLGRWPDGAQSALSVTGDVDALTIWDYAYRLVGR